MIRNDVACRALMVGSAMVLAGCALQQEQVEQQLAEPPPINCRSADHDIQVLRTEKANVLERMAEGVSAVYPGGAIVGILMGTEGTKVQVATGDYNRMIDARIAGIQRRCGR